MENVRIPSLLQVELHQRLHRNLEARPIFWNEFCYHFYSIKRRKYQLRNLRVQHVGLWHLSQNGCKCFQLG
jgi:hypothetical protein